MGGRTAARPAGPHVGGLDDSPGGYLGSQPVDLTPTDDWAELFVERRVRPLTGRAVELGRIDPAVLAEVERISPHAAERCGPPESPSLLHDDLWAGNRSVDTTGVNWLIDPPIRTGTPSSTWP